MKLKITQEAEINSSHSALASVYPAVRERWVSDNLGDCIPLRMTTSHWLTASDSPRTDEVPGYVGALF